MSDLIAEYNTGADTSEHTVQRVVKYGALQQTTHTCAHVDPTISSITIVVGTETRLNRGSMETCQLVR